MADVPGAPDPKGFQYGNGGKILLESGLKLVGAVGKSAGEGINKHFKDAADHNKNVAMRAWDMQARHVLRKDFATHQNELDMNRDAQQQSSDERINATKVKGKTIAKAIKPAIKAQGKKELVKEQNRADQATMRTSSRETTKLREAGARETTVNKEGTQASFAPKRATAAKKPQPAQTAQSKNQKAIRKAMRGNKSR